MIQMIYVQSLKNSGDSQGFDGIYIIYDSQRNYDSM